MAFHLCSHSSDKDGQPETICPISFSPEPTQGLILGPTRWKREPVPRSIPLTYTGMPGMPDRQTEIMKTRKSPNPVEILSSELVQGQNTMSVMTCISSEKILPVCCYGSSLIIAVAPP